jgi:hypothetical protein
MSIFSELKDTIVAMAKDLSVLEVNTFTGDLEAIIEAQAEDDRTTLLDWDKLQEEAMKKGKITLAASTKVFIDGDQNQYLATDLPADIYTVHQAAVESGLKVRQGFVRLVKDIF